MQSYHDGSVECNANGRLSDSDRRRRDEAIDKERSDRELTLQRLGYVEQWLRIQGPAMLSNRVWRLLRGIVVEMHAMGPALRGDWLELDLSCRRAAEISQQNLRTANRAINDAVDGQWLDIVKISNSHYAGRYELGVALWQAVYEWVGQVQHTKPLLLVPEQDGLAQMPYGVEEEDVVCGTFIGADEFAAPQAGGAGTTALKIVEYLTASRTDQTTVDELVEIIGVGVEAIRKALANLRRLGVISGEEAIELVKDRLKRMVKRCERVVKMRRRHADQRARWSAIWPRIVASKMGSSHVPMHMRA